MSLDVHLSTGFEANITHNLTDMAEAAGIYGIVWRPDENDVTCAGDLIEPLKNAVHNMLDNPEKFEAFNAPNGWGTYRVFVRWLFDYLMACVENPQATVEVFR